MRPSSTIRYFIAGLMLTLAAGFAPPPANAQTTLRVSANTPVGTLDTVKMRVGALEYNYAFLVFSRLTGYDASLNVIPDLAERWEVSPDQKVWTFFLRKGVKFHNGREVDAEDVLAVFRRIADPANGSLIRGSISILEKTEAVDKHTVRFTLSIPYSAWPAIVGNFQASIVPREAADTLTTQPIGSGPYRFENYQPEGLMTLAKNPDYFVAGVPKLDKIVFRIIPDFTTAVAALEREEIDLVWGLPPELVDRVAKAKTAQVSEVPTGSWQTLIMNNTMAPFDNPKVRQAFVKLIDRALIAEIAMFGHATPTISPIPPGHAFYDSSIPIGKPDPAAAKKLLAEAGYPNGFSVGIWTPAKQPVRERIAVAVRDLAKAANITIEVNTVPEDQYNPGKFPLSTGSFYGRTQPDIMLYEWYHSNGAWNKTTWHYKNEEVDKILDAARQTSDINEQKKLYTRFQTVVTADDPGPVLFVGNNATGVGNRVQGFRSSPLMFLDLRNVTLKN